MSDCNDTTVDFYMGCKNIKKSGMILYTCGRNVQSKTKSMDYKMFHEAKVSNSDENSAI